MGTSSGPRQPLCAVCGTRVLGPAFQLTDGRVWCSMHAGLPRCAWCDLPVRTAASDELHVCHACSRTAVTSSGVVRLVKDELKQHMAALGVVVDRPTRISLVHRDAFGPRSPNARSHEIGRASWTLVGHRAVDGPIVVEVLRGVPLPRFRHVLAHEFGHAALAGSARGHRLPRRVQEGFAEATAVVHLRDSRRDVDWIVDDLLANPDPVYGAGLRLVLPAVDRHGLDTVLRALQAGDEQVLGIRPRAPARR